MAVSVDHDPVKGAADAVIAALQAAVSVHFDNAIATMRRVGEMHFQTQEGREWATKNLLNLAQQLRHQAQKWDFSRLPKHLAEFERHALEKASANPRY